ncbi:MAG: hypothetical protein IPL84_05005 [Chitinophagaceae bacterium]|nr:hypothetical protein [Chitinophagaceae bacterium]
MAVKSKKVVTQPAAAKKSALKKAVPKKSNVKKAPAKKPIVKKAAKKVAVKKKIQGTALTAKKEVIKKITIKKAAAKNAVVKKHIIKRVKAKIIHPPAGMPHIIPIDALIDHAVKTEDPMMRFDKEVFKKATSKVDPRHNMLISSKSKKTKMPSAKKPLWRK